MPQTRYTILRRNPLTMRSVSAPLVWIPRFRSAPNHRPRPVAMHRDGLVHVSDGRHQLQTFEVEHMLDFRLAFHDGPSDPIIGPTRDEPAPMVAPGLTLVDVHLHDGRVFDALIILEDQTLVGLHPQASEPEWFDPWQILHYRRPGSVVGLTTCSSIEGPWKARRTGQTPHLGRWSR